MNIFILPFTFKERMTLVLLLNHRNMTILYVTFGTIEEAKYICTFIVQVFLKLTDTHNGHLL